MSHVLHSCDISGQSKKQSLAKEWCQRCLSEFFIQGDTEKSLGLKVSPLCDRDSTPVATSQIGFINFIVLPTYQALALVLPECNKYVLNLQDNVKYWESRKAGDN